MADQGLERYRGSLGTGPRVWYANLHRWEKAFIAASVVRGDDDECAEGACMSVSRGGQACGEAAADLFGEVLVDKLEPGAEYEVTITLEGYEPATCTVTLEKSTNLGTITLAKA